MFKIISSVKMWGYIAVKILKDPHFIYILKFILVNAIDSCRRKNVTIKCQRERKILKVQNISENILFLPLGLVLATSEDKAGQVSESSKQALKF